MQGDLIDDYARRIAAAIRLLERCEKGEPMPGLGELAGAACLSPFHFHRIFRLMTGEPVGAFVTRFRLARTMDALTNGAATITQAAAGSGYASSQSFARAFSATTGHPPREAKHDAETAERIARQLRTAPEAAAPLGLEIVTLDPISVVALRRDGPYETLDTAYDVLFAAVFDADPATTIRRIWGVPLDDPASIIPDRLRFDCALELEGGSQQTYDADGVHNIQLAPGRALCCEHHGSYDAIFVTLDSLYLAALSKGHAIGEHPPVITYHTPPDEVPEADLRAALYLPLRSD